MAFLDEENWRGRVYSGGWVTSSGGDAAVTEPATGNELDDEPNVPFGGVLDSGTGTRFGGSANLDDFTETRWVTVRGDIAPYPF